MVPADDEHKDTPEVDSTASTKECKGSRLTPMPKCLMHWWIPFVLAAFLFLGSMFITSIWGSATFDEIMHAIQDCPKRWPFHMRTPSREEIEVCLTITAAGFAFSAWQQRSHDNAAKEKEQAMAQQQAEKEQKRQEQNRLEQIERDEYWKRREQAYKLLGSNNPALRLGAITLLSELADATSKASTFSDTEKQELQRYIINTLCLQVRQEGIINDESSKQEHIAIQQLIIDTILRRIKAPLAPTQYADWSQETIPLTTAKILTPISIQDISTNASLDFSESIICEPLTIIDSQIEAIHWKSTVFLKHISIKSELSDCHIHTDTLPENYSSATFDGVTISTRHNNLAITPPPKQENRLTISKCTFKKKYCSCRISCPCRNNTDREQCTCRYAQECTCSTNCTNSPIDIFNTDITQDQDLTKGSLWITNCSISSINLYLTSNQSDIHIEGNIISNSIYIQYEHSYEEILGAPNGSERESFIKIYNNEFSSSSPEPIEIQINTSAAYPEPIDLFANYIKNPDNLEEKRYFEMYYQENEPEPYFFAERDDSRFKDRLITPWHTGGEYEDN